MALGLSVLGGTMAISAPRTALVRTGLDSHLVRVLEQRFTPAPIADWTHVRGLIVAGGSLARAEEAFRLAALHPHLRIILSGPSDAEVRAALRVTDERARRILIDRQPQNTHENALLSKALVAPKAGERWLLVTSASHMPRAIGTFYAAGFEVEAWPVADGADGDTPQVAAHEWLGLVAYWLRGQTIALFPSERDVLEARRALETRRGLTQPG